MPDESPAILSPDEESRVIYGVLNAVEEDSALTQRSVASQLGIALGLANAYFKRCVKKGYLKVSMAPRNRYAYYLTPTGFAEKSRLTAEFLRQSMNLFRTARDQISALFAECARAQRRRVVLCGAGDLAEIATLCAHEHGIVLVALFDEGRPGDSFHGLPVVRDFAALPPHDALVVSDLAAPQRTIARLAELGAPPERVLAPGLLSFVRHRQPSPRAPAR